MGLSGVQRIAKFVKYLPAYGWAPTVLTVKPGGYFAFDESLLEELDQPEIAIVRTKAIDPTRIFRQKQAVSLPQESSRKRLSALSQFLFIPDNKIGWLRPALKVATRLHKKHPFDCVLATCPPYTNALIARRVSKRCGIPYMLDFRDDWLGNPRHEYATKLHQVIHKSLERKSFEDASAIVTINSAIEQAMKNRHPQWADKIDVLAQGFDPTDFSESAEAITPTSNQKTKKLTLVYSGVFYDVQKPDYFLKALAAFLEEQPDARSHIEARFLGLIPKSGVQLIEQLNLAGIAHYEGYLPHKEVVMALTNADVLWMTVGSGPGQETISTSKLFEYIGSRKPIFGLVPDGAARETLTAYGASLLAYPENVEEIKNQLRLLYNLWINNQLPVPAEDVVNQFNRWLLTGELSALLTRICVTA